MSGDALAPTFAARLTPAGRSAIAVVLVRGPRAYAAVDACFRAANGRPVAEQPADAVRFGRWGGKRGEELVICRRSTREGDPHEVEVHCHGGQAAVAAVLGDLTQHGCEVTAWDAAEVRAATSLIAAEAERALAEAATERVAGVLLDQLGGALEREAASAVEALQKGDLPAAAETVAALVARSRLGLRLTKPWRVALVGPPNVGKSRLMNALVGYERAIVFDRPGTTRDVVAAATAIDGWPVELMDTAGVREAGDALEAAGVERTRAVLAAADLVLAAAEAGPTAERDWRAIEAELPAETPRLRVATKADLLSGATPTHGNSIVTSAATGAGVGELIDAIGAAIVPDPPPAGAAVPFTERQATLLAQAATAFDAGDSSSALAALQSLLC